MTTPYQVVMNTPLGPIGLIFSGARLAQLDFLSAQVIPLPFAHKVESAAKATSWIERYFQNPNTVFPLPVLLQGTPFQVNVWKALQKIPLGETWTYGLLAKRLQTAPRAIGLACRQNPLPIIIPCHRVVAQAGLGGYCGTINGQIWESKQWLLLHEKKYSICREHVDELEKQA